MAEKRMFSKSIIDSDIFTSMPLSTQALYFHLSMRADDEGFVDKTKGIAKLIGANEDDIKLLLAKRYILAFESGIVVIKHWWIHNYIREDRIKPTNYQEELRLLKIKDNNSYTENYSCQSNVSQMSVKCQARLDKNSIDKNRLDNSKRFIKPTIDEINSYCKEKGYSIDAEHFCNYYESKGWLVGKTPMKNWKAAVSNWARNDFNKKPNKKVAEMPEIDF